ncbi:hypothetical protein [Cellulosimicrobium sp. Marseille-Q4280]|uniref:hypothetical protein n=1 Tax=Cellulosimicrobium sp. Marseille-Q4280 TaxID=2937992 RepID=UPI00203D2405|nr:hypothetical protein [Cellulosimicrobium sp. Marseille-Q4280]
MSVHVPTSSSEASGARREEAPRPAAWPALTALGAALAAAVTVVVAATTPHSDVRLWASIVGYALGAVVVTVLVSVHKSKDNRSRQHPEFRPRPLWDTVLRVALVLGLVAAAGDAYLLATEVSKW